MNLRSKVFLLVAGIFLSFTLNVNAQEALANIEVVDTQSQEVAAGLAASITNPNVKIAVGDFTIGGTATGFGDLWKKNLVHYLAIVPGRSYTLLAEPGNHDIIVEGEMLNFGEFIRIYTRTLKPDTREILYSHKTDISINDLITTLVAQAGTVIIARDAYEVNDSIETATDITIDGSLTISASFHAATDVDFYRVTVPEGGSSLKIETQGSKDTYLHLFNEQGTEIATDDDSGENYCSRLIQNLEAGVYFLKVREYDSSTGDYSVVFTFSEPLRPDELEPNDDKDSSKVIDLSSGSAQLTLNFNSGSDVDWFRFTIAAPSQFTATTVGSFDTIISVTDAEGTEVASDDDSGDDYNAKVETALNPGEYFLKINEYNNSTGEYTLNITVSASAQ